MKESVLALLKALENNDVDAMAALYAEDAVQVEFPNRLLDAGARRTRAELIEACRRGAALMARQSYKLTSLISEGDMVALEADWEAQLAIDAPPLGLAKGDTMRAHFAQFLRFRDGKIVEHRTYDCFPDWRKH